MKIFVSTSNAEIKLTELHTEKARLEIYLNGIQKQLDQLRATTGDVKSIAYIKGKVDRTVSRLKTLKQKIRDMGGKDQQAHAKADQSTEQQNADAFHKNLKQALLAADSAPKE